MVAWEATIAARIAMIIPGQNIPGGTVLKKGFDQALPVVSVLMYAACPM
jgi:hypothetical protein